MISRGLNRLAVAPLVWALSVPLCLWVDLQAHRRFFRLYPKKALPIRLANVSVVTFGLLLWACWGVTMLLIAMGMVYDALTGNIQWALYGRMAVGATFAVAVWTVGYGAISWVLSKAEGKLTSGLWVSPRL